MTKQQGKRLTIILPDDLYDYIDREAREDYSNRAASKGAVIRRIIRHHKEARELYQAVSRKSDR